MSNKDGKSGDLSAADAAGGGSLSRDALALGDVLAVYGAVDPCNITSNLHFRFDSTTGNTLVEMRSSDGVALAQPAVLQGDLTSGGSLSDSQVIQSLLALGKPFD